MQYPVLRRTSAPLEDVQFTQGETDPGHPCPSTRTATDLDLCYIVGKAVNTEDEDWDF
jgi:hypothetical protein